MLRSFLRLLSKPPQKPSLVEIDANRIVLYAQVERPTRNKVVSLPTKTQPKQVSASPSHRERLLSMRLEHTKLCSTRRCQRFQELGIVTAGDLACATPERLAVHFRASRKAERVIKHYRRAIRFAAAVPGMMPRDAMLLISIHRRSVRGLGIGVAGRFASGPTAIRRKHKGTGSAAWPPGAEHASIETLDRPM